MEMTFQIIYLEEVVTKHIPKLANSAKVLIKKAIEERLTTNPIAYGKPLRCSLKGHRRIRIGDYRVVYRVEAKIVTIVAIAHRKDIYES
jgi:addiction module RelE/StbE family toxin